jgi:aryl-alcohol dehydrogenase-like predicted oxidoreductase
VSAIGLGCWAIGGPWDWISEDGTREPEGWGAVDDGESIRAIHLVLDRGVNFLDTAANYGCGHSEQLVGKAIAGRRAEVVLATKFGYLVDSANRTVSSAPDIVGKVRSDCESSLKNLGTDYLDLFQLHVDDCDPVVALEVREELEKLVNDGKIRWYGWSTDDFEQAEIFAGGAHCTAVQHTMHMGWDAPEMRPVCEAHDLASVTRSPLGMGILTGKFTPETTFHTDDVRHGWNLKTGVYGPKNLRCLAEVIDLFAKRGDTRTPAQIALTWILSRSPRTIPIPGFKTTTQVEDNVGVLEQGLFDDATMQEIDRIFGRTAVQ